MEKVDLMGQYTLKGKDNTSINFISLTMIDLPTSWFEIKTLPTKFTVPNRGEGEELTCILT